MTRGGGAGVVSELDCSFKPICIGLCSCDVFRKGGRVSTPALKERIDRVHQLDLEPIKFKLVKGENGHMWTIEKVDAVEIEYKRFLILNLQNAVTKEVPSIVPTKDVDAFWHAHILDTKKYMVDCDHCFGYYLHHFPYLGMRGEADAELLKSSFQQTLQLYRRQFGSNPPSMNASSECDAEQCSPDHDDHGHSPEHKRPILLRNVRAAECESACSADCGGTCACDDARVPAANAPRLTRSA